MEQRILGQTGLTVSRLGAGLAEIGYELTFAEQDRAARLLNMALDNGINYFDTAAGYGISEALIGRTMAHRRADYILATKCGLVWHTAKGNHFFDYEGRPVHRYLGADSIRYEVEQSLKRLGTDHIDHYITHWQDPTTPVEETMDALKRLKAEGKIRSIGASNLSVEDLNAYVAAGGLDAIQEEYSMVRRDIETTLLPWPSAS